MAGRLEGKAAIITGGASGIGRATAERFAAEGAAVLIADVRPNPDDDITAVIRAAGGQAVFEQVDTSSAADTGRMVERAQAEFGRIDVLVAAAGVSHASYVRGINLLDLQGQAEERKIVNLPLEDWERVLSINLTGVMLSDRAVARAMVATGTRGAIVNISSMYARIPVYGHGDYCIAKAGVLMLTKVLALELAPHGIRVNAIGPGGVDTPMIERIMARIPGRMASDPAAVSGRLGRPSEIAATALFLATDESSFFTGEILYADGGTFTE